MTDFEDRLAYFKTLQRNWDSYGADPISETAITAAAELIQQATKKPSFIAPTPEGGVELEWQFDDFGDVELEVEISSDGKLDTLLIQKVYTEHADVPLDGVLALIEASKRC